MSEEHASLSFRIGILTLSDKGSRGERVDESGEILREMASALGEICCYKVIPDEFNLIVDTLRDWADRQNLDLLLTTGGTGLSPRDVTPEATRAVIDREVPGMAEAMRAASLAKTPHAMISRAVVGLRGYCMIANMPGSPRAVRENFDVLLPALPHALAKLKGDPSDCAR